FIGGSWKMWQRGCSKTYNGSPQAGGKKDHPEHHERCHPCLLVDKDRPFIHLAVSDLAPCQIEKQHPNDKYYRYQVQYKETDGDPEHTDLEKTDDAGKDVERILLHRIADVS